MPISWYPCGVIESPPFSMCLRLLLFWNWILYLFEIISCIRWKSLLFSVYSILISINILESLSSRVVVIVRYPSRVLVFNFLLSHSYHQISVSCCSSASENAKEHPSVCFSRFSHRFLLLLFVCSSLLWILLVHNWSTSIPLKPDTPTPESTSLPPRTMWTGRTPTMICSLVSCRSI